MRNVIPAATAFVLAGVAVGDSITAAGANGSRGRRSTIFPDRYPPAGLAFSREDVRSGVESTTRQIIVRRPFAQARASG